MPAPKKSNKSTLVRKKKTAAASKKSVASRKQALKPIINAAEREKVGSSVPWHYTSSGAKLHRGLETLAIVVVFLLIGFLGSLFYQNFMVEKKLAEFLPADSVAMYVEVNLNNTKLAKRWQDLFADYEGLREKDIEKYTSDLWGLDFERQIKPWFNGKLRVVLLQDGPSVFFLGSKNAAGGLSRIKNSDDSFAAWNDGISFSRKNSLAVAAFRDYVVFSKDPEVLDSLMVKLQRQDLSDSLVGNVWFKKSQQEHSKSALVYLFLKTDKLVENWRVMRWLSMLPEVPLEAWPQLAKALPAVSAEMVPEKKQLAWQIYPHLVDGALSSSGGFWSRLGDTGVSLAEFYPSDTVFYLQSGNLVNKYTEIKSYLTEASPYLGAIVAGYENKMTVRMNMSLVNDVLAVLDKGFAFGVTARDGSPAFLLAVYNSEFSKNTDDTHLLLHDLFAKYTLLFPQQQKIKLPDGTEGYELVAEIKDPRLSKESYKSGELFTLSANGLPYQISYGFDGGVLLISNNKSLLQDGLAGRTPSLEGGSLYAQIAGISARGSRAIGNLEAASALLSEPWRKVVSPFSGIVYREDSIKGAREITVQLPVR